MALMHEVLTLLAALVTKCIDNDGVFGLVGGVARMYEQRFRH